MRLLAVAAVAALVLLPAVALGPTLTPAEAAAAFGQREWLARLPSAAAGILTAVLAARLAGVVLGRRAVRPAGFFAATTAYVQLAGGTAGSGLPATAFVTGGFVALAELVLRPHGSRGKPNVALALCAAGAFAFGGTWAFVPLGIAVALVVPPRRPIVTELLNPVGLTLLGVLLAATLTLPQWPGQVESQPADLLWAAVPWVPLAVVGAWRRDALATPAGRVTAALLAAGLAGGGAGVGPLAVVAAVGWHRVRAVRIPDQPAYAWSAAVVVAAVIGIGGMLWAGGYRLWPIAVPAGIVAATVAVAPHRRAALPAGVAVAWAAWHALTPPLLDRWQPHADLGRRLADRVPAGETVALIDPPPTPIGFYATRPLRPDGPGRYAIVRRSAEVGDVAVLDWEQPPVGAEADRLVLILRD